MFTFTSKIFFIVLDMVLGAAISGVGIVALAFILAVVFYVIKVVVTTVREHSEICKSEKDEK